MKAKGQIIGLALVVGFVLVFSGTALSHGNYGCGSGCNCNDYVNSFSFQGDGGNGADTYTEWYASCGSSGSPNSYCGGRWGGGGCSGSCSQGLDRFQFRDPNNNYDYEYTTNTAKIWTDDYGNIQPGETIEVRPDCGSQWGNWQSHEIPAYPSVDGISYNDAGNDHAFTVRAVVSDANGDGDINSCDLSVDDNDGYSNNYNMNLNRGYGNGNEARCTQRVDYDDSSGWGMDENMDIQVTVQDNDKGWTDSSSSSHSFPNRRPDDPSNPSPTNDENQVPTSPTLQVDVSDQDGDSMDVTFYDASDDSVIGSVGGAGDGSSPSVTWDNLDPGTQYAWYAEADDSRLTEQSSTWSFTTSYTPVVDSFSVSDVSDDHAFTTDVTFSDPDGDDDIISCEREIRDGSGNVRIYSGTVDRSVGNGNQAGCTFSNPVRASDEGGWSHTGQMTVEVRAEDNNGNIGRDTTLYTFPNHDPSIQSDPTFDDVSDAHAFDVTANAIDTDGPPGQTEFDQCTIIHENGQKSGTLTETGENAECTGTVGISDGYDVHEQVDVSVRFTDIHGASAETVQRTHEIPNRPPEYSGEKRFPQTLPSANSNTWLRMNMSDAESDDITWANFTIWEYNSQEGVVRQEFVNDPGTLYERSSYWLINSSAIFTDLSGASYNVSITVSDGYDTRTIAYPFTQPGTSSTWFTLQDVKPNVSEPTLTRPAPYNLQSSTYRPGQSIEARFTVRDLNGRANLDEYDIRIVDGNGYREDVEGVEIQNQVGNGYDMSVFHNLDSDIPEGTYEFRINATDQEGLTTMNSTSFEVTAYEDVTTSLEYPQSQESVYVDGSEVTGTDTTRDSADFPYVVETNGTVMTGLIDYGRFQQLSYADDGSSTTMEVRQDLEDNNILLPVAEADTFDLSELQSEFTGGIFSGQGFLDYATASLAFGVSEEKSVRVEASFEDNDDILLRGFNGTLGTGTFDLGVRNGGREDGMTVAEVNR